MDRSGADSHSPRNLPIYRASRPSGLPRHAGGLCALLVPRKTLRLFDAAQLDRTRQRHQRRRASARVSRRPESLVSDWSARKRLRISPVPWASERKGGTKRASLENLHESSKIIRMDFGAFNPDLMPGARNAVV